MDIILRQARTKYMSSEKFSQSLQIQRIDKAFARSFIQEHQQIKRKVCHAAVHPEIVRTENVCPPDAISAVAQHIVKCIVTVLVLS